VGKESRTWRRWLRDLADDLAADEWEKAAGSSGHEPTENHGGAQASLDEILRDATEAREPGHEGENPAT
jgi:hypothetical protein